MSEETFVDDAHGDDEPDATTSGSGGGRGPIIAVVVVVAVVIGALVLLLGTSGNDHEADTSKQVLSREAPSLKGVDTKGDALDLDSLRGRWVLVNFFATWCPPCVAEHPQLVAFSKAHADDATVISVAFDEAAPVVEDFFASHGGDWPVLADSGTVPLDWGVVKLPESFLIAPDGTVVDKIPGGVTATGVEKMMAEYSSAGKGGSTDEDGSPGNDAGGGGG